MTHHQPSPSPRPTSSGRVMVTVLVTAGVLYVLSPEARPGVGAAVPVLLAMLPAALAGAVCRVALDLLEGPRGGGAREPWPLFLSALLLLGAAGWMVGNGWRLVETAPLAGGVWEGVLALLLPLAALGAVVLAARAGYRDGAEQTLSLGDLRRERVWSPVPVTRLSHRRTR